MDRLESPHFADGYLKTNHKGEKTDLQDFSAPLFKPTSTLLSPGLVALKPAYLK